MNQPIYLCPPWCEAASLGHEIGENLNHRDGLLRQHIAQVDEIELSVLPDTYDPALRRHQRVVEAAIVQDEITELSGVTVAPARVWLSGLGDPAELTSTDLSKLAELIAAARTMLGQVEQ